MDKPFMEHDELVERLRARGLKCDGRTKPILEREGYYAVVNGYKDLFLDDGRTRLAGDDRYIDGAEFFELYRLFVMDRRLRAILFRYIVYAEATLKSVSTYEFCIRHRDDNEDYLLASSYRDDGNYPELVAGFIENLDVALGRNPKRQPKHMRDYLKHYISSHDNVPLWVLMNNLDLGQAFRFYAFQPEGTRFAIARRIQRMYSDSHHGSRRITHEGLRKSYDHIKDFRNICAHDERLFSAKVDKSKSTTFARMMDDLQSVLTGLQYKQLLQDVSHQLISASSQIHTVGVAEILAQMGYTSMDELLPADK